jgi:predicted phage tail protein
VAEIAEWTDSHKLSGMAYAHVRFDGLENFGSGIPNISAKIRGRKVYDPRTDTTAWSANPALCVRDYLLADFGLQEDASSINDTLFNNVADFCDEDIGGSPRFQCNGSFALDSTPEEIIRNLISSFGGIFWNYQGQWAIQPADWRESSLSLTEDDLRGSLEVATRHSRQSNFNTVVGQYKGEETDWQLDNFRPIQDELYLQEDNGIVASSELKLSFSTTENQARRIAAIYLRKNRQQITVSGTFGLRALGVKVGDTVDLTIDHLGWTNKTFEVVDWRLSQEELKLVVGMILRETNEEVYTGVVRAITDESGNALQDESGNELEAIVL